MSSLLDFLGICLPPLTGLHISRTKNISVVWCITKYLVSSSCVMSCNQLQCVSCFNNTYISLLKVENKISPAHIYYFFTVFSLSLTFLLLPIFLHISSAQQCEDDARLRVDSYSCHQHPAWALHHMGTLTPNTVTFYIKIPLVLTKWTHQMIRYVKQMQWELGIHCKGLSVSLKIVIHMTRPERYNVQCLFLSLSSPTLERHVWHFVS